MMEVEKEKARPNIRIEIQNEKMDVDESEEGEIIDDDSDTAVKVSSENIGKVLSNSTRRNVFTTGINIFDQHEQQKRQERAKRFALKPEEIHCFSEADVEELYESLGISSDNDPTIRFDAVHLHGIAGLTAENILDYFAKYAPASLEWIDADSCNVLWMDTVTSARAIFYNSKAVSGMPAREQVNTFAKEFMDDIDNTEEDNSGRSILLKNRQVELKVDDVLKLSKINLKNSVDISEITIPIPPGYWRLGGTCPKTDCILMSFALKTDKKPYRAETLSKYYKKLSNAKGIIDEGKKKEIHGIFERNKELNGKKNPWGSLALNWDQDAKFRERVPDHLDEPQVELKNPGLLVRLGKKRMMPEPEEEEEEDKVDAEENAVEEEEEAEVRSRGAPRMRMYADEEEEKMKRRKLLQTIKRQAEKLATDEAKTEPRDLRNILSVTNYKEPVEIIDLVLEEDLGKKLKNRSKHMVYSVEHDVDKMPSHERKENVRSTDIRAVIEHRKREHRRVLRERRRSRSPLSRHDRVPSGRRSPSRDRRRSHFAGRSSHRTLHSDRMEARRRRTRRSQCSDDEFGQKPRSKVAVVIKTQKKPTVASTIWSRVKSRGGDEGREDGSEDSDSSSGSSASDSESDESDRSSSSSGSESTASASSSSSSSTTKRPKKNERTGFWGTKAREPSSLRVTMPNDRYKR